MQSIIFSLSKLAETINQNKKTNNEEISKQINNVLKIYNENVHIYNKISPKYSKELKYAINNIKYNSADYVDMLDYILDSQNIVSYISKQ